MQLLMTPSSSFREVDYSRPSGDHKEEAIIDFLILHHVPTFNLFSLKNSSIISSAC
jgi:hypothetical protein